MTEVLDKSVTRDDQGDYKAGRGLQGVLNIIVSPWAHVAGAGLPADIGYAWSTYGDAMLRSTPYHEAMWAGALSKAITKIAAQGWTVKDSDDSKRRTSLAQDILLHADGGKGWVSFISKHLRSYLLTRNGAFVEIVRASGARGAKVMGLVHLSPFQCQRTGDPDYPVLYTDRRGRVHPLRDYQVLTFSDMPDDDEHLLDVGFPAAMRAYRTIYKLAALERYVSDKITGNRALALHFVQGLSPESLKTALKTADAEQMMKGAVAYMGAIVVPILSDAGITVASVPLSEIPDGFDAKQERDNAYLIYANAIGVPVQDIQPLSGQGLGTGTQTQVLDDAAEGMGLAAWRKAFEQAINERVLPGATTFTFITNDVRDQKAKAEVQKVRADTRKVMVETGTITAQQSLQLALDADDVPPEFLPNDQTAAGQLTDTEKPIEPAQGGQAAGASPEPQPAQPTAPQLRAAVQRAIAAKGYEGDIQNPVGSSGSVATEEIRSLEPLRENFSMASQNGHGWSIEANGVRASKEISLSHTGQQQIVAMRPIPGGSQRISVNIAPPPVTSIAQRLKAAPDDAALVDAVAQEIAELTAALESGQITREAWERGLLDAITRGHERAMLDGTGLDELDDWGRRMVDSALDEQRGYLRGFADEMAQAQLDGAGWDNRWGPRAEMYAQSVKASYWRGATRGYALPAVPGDGTTQCLTNCKCRWEIVTLEGDGNVDAYWRMGDAEHCQTCVQRAADWAPYQIRDGEVVI